MRLLSEGEQKLQHWSHALETDGTARSTWTGVGGTTFNASDTKNGAASSRFGYSRNAASTSRGAGAESSNFDVTSMGTLGYNQTVSFNGGAGSVPKLNRTGFTNRLTLGDMGVGQGEEWEMGTKSSSSPGEKPEDFGESPTTSTMGGKAGETTVDLGSDSGDASSVELDNLPHTTINGRAL